MFDPFKPRLLMSKIQGNVLMTQIRAERKTYQCRNQPIFISSHRDVNKSGKKIFKQHLYNTTALFREDPGERSACHSYSRSPAKQNKQINRNLKTGKRVGYCDPGMQRSLSARGKKKAMGQNFCISTSNIIGFDPRPKIDTSPIRYTRKRYDQSPNHQNRLSPGFNLFKSEHIFQNK